MSYWSLRVKEDKSVIVCLGQESVGEVIIIYVAVEEDVAAANHLGLVCAGTGNEEGSADAPPALSPPGARVCHSPAGWLAQVTTATGGQAGHALSGDSRATENRRSPDTAWRTQISVASKPGGTRHQLKYPFPRLSGNNTR